MIPHPQIGPIEAAQRAAAYSARNKVWSAPAAPMLRIVSKPAREPIDANQHVLDWRVQTSGSAFVLAECAKRGVDIEQLRAPGRRQCFVMLRGEFAFILRDRFGWKYPRIGLFFNRDHSSVHNCITKYCRVAGLTRPPKQERARITDDLLSEVKALVASGSLIGHAAYCVGASTSGVTKRAIAQGWYVPVKRGQAR